MIEYIVSSLSKTLEFWGSLPMYLQAFIVVVVFVSSVMETVKRSFLTKLSKKSRKVWIWRSSFLIGCLSGYYGSTIHGHLETWQWIIIGGMSGSASNGLHWLTVKVAFPYLIKKIKRKENVQSN